jgi:hypothetical protein
MAVKILGFSLKNFCPKSGIFDIPRDAVFAKITKNSPQNDRKIPNAHAVTIYFSQHTQIFPKISMNFQAVYTLEKRRFNKFN